MKKQLSVLLVLFTLINFAALPSAEAGKKKPSRLVSALISMLLLTQPVVLNGPTLLPEVPREANLESNLALGSCLVSSAPGGRARSVEQNPTWEVCGAVDLASATLPTRLSEDRFWAQRKVQAEEMKIKVNEILAKNGGDRGTVPVAVVDSGFRSEYNSEFHSNGTVHTRTFLLNSVRTDKDHPAFKTVYTQNGKDPHGHGTAVSGLIAAKTESGIGVGLVNGGISLAVYETPSVSPSEIELFKFLEKACEENRDPLGITIVNFSWRLGSDISYNYRFLGKIPAKRVEKSFASYLRKFADEGCLIVSAAGNDGYSGPHINDIDDAFLRVEAIDADGKKASYSSVGEVAAPGTDVWTTTAHKLGSPGQVFLRHDVAACDSARPDSLLQCEKISGTSFAAPIVAGIAAQVVRVLKSQPYFQKLAPAKRIQLVNRIIKYSQVNGVVNGLEAVQFAQFWNLEEAKK
jgi:subtilisin family serine protease